MLDGFVHINCIHPEVTLQCKALAITGVVMNNIPLSFGKPISRMNF